MALEENIENPKPEDVVPPIETTIINPDSTISPDTEKDELKQKVATYEFKEKLGEVSKTYPHAREYENEISEKVKQGYSIEDASIIVLNQKGQLQTAEQLQRQTNQSGGAGFGGSMDNPIPREQKDPVPGEPGSAKFYADRFRDLEAKGEIRVV